MKLRSFRKNKRGMTGLVIAAIILFLSLVVIIPISILVEGTIYSTVTDSLQSAGISNATAVSLHNNVASAFSIMAILPLIAVVGIIISAIVGGFAYYKSR